MSFAKTAARLTRSPDPFDAGAGQDAVAAYGELPPELAALIAGAGGCSPYLAQLLGAESDWLIAALEDPERAARDLIDGCATLPPDSLARDLRRAKGRIALLIALCDLGGIWPLETVTGTLTDFADAALGAAIQATVRAEAARGKLPGLSADDIGPDAAGFVALAMGKMGAGELNYSSDIDLICLFDETRFDPGDYTEARSGLVRATRRLTSLLSERTADGYVFRTDLRLRPDPAVTPVCLSIETAERYYEILGRTWERAAYIKARPAAGDLAAGTRFLKALTPFVWRKHLDYAAIEDAHDMRLKIRDAKGLGGPITLPGHNLKLGRGGIREIEFFTQTRQLIAGGRDPSLRLRGTVEGLGALTAAGWIEAEVTEALSGHYRFLREIEHRLQMIRDARTHELPATDEGFDRLAAFTGRSTAELRADLTERLGDVHSRSETFFAPRTDAATTAPADFGADTVARWHTYPALRSDRAVTIFERLRPQLLSRLAGAADPEAALRHFDSFLSGLPAGVQLFSLFEANPQLLELIVDITTTAPELSRYLSHNSGVLDAVIGGDFFAPWPGTAEGQAGALETGLSAALAAAGDYEAKLDATRRWAKEWHFRIGVHHLQGLIDAVEAGRQYADLARVVVWGLWPVVIENFAVRHGPPPGRGAGILGMGSLGAERLHSLSDLDLIVIYDAEGQDASEGPRPLTSGLYYARLTQALVTALTALTAEGRLYEVDMRLRPSGRQGPVATSFAAFRAYQREKAWTWEHLALTRARVICGPDGFAESFGAFLADLRAELHAKATGGATAQILADVADMRRRVAGAKPAETDWDPKQGPGKLFDIDLVAQTVALLTGTAARDSVTQLKAGPAAGVLDEGSVTVLTAALDLFWSMQSATRLLVGEAELDPEALSDGGRAMLLRDTGQPDLASLRDAMVTRAAQAGRIIDAIIGPGPDPDPKAGS